MPPSSEQQNPVPAPVAPVPAKTASTTIKVIRIFLLVLIVIGVGLIATQSLWVPKIIGVILQTQTPTAPVNQPSSYISYTNAQLWMPLANASSSSYAIKNGQVVFNSSTYPYQTVLSDADPNTFEISSFWSPQLAKDTSNVYYYSSTGGSEISDADAPTFEPIFVDSATTTWQYARDKNTFYAFSSYYPYVQAIPGVDVSSFTLVYPAQSCGFGCIFDAQDKNYRYYQGQIVQAISPPFYLYTNQSLGFTIEVPQMSTTSVGGSSWGLPVSVFVSSQSSTSSVVLIDYSSSNGQPLSSYIQNVGWASGGPPNPIEIDTYKVDNQQTVVAALQQNFYGNGQCGDFSSNQLRSATTSQSGVYYVGLQGPDTVVPQGQVLGEFMNDFAGDSDPCAWAPVAKYYPAGGELAIIKYSTQYCPFPIGPGGGGDGNSPGCYEPLVAQSLQFLP